MAKVAQTQHLFSFGHYSSHSTAVLATLKVPFKLGRCVYALLACKSWQTAPVQLMADRVFLRYPADFFTSSRTVFQLSMDRGVMYRNRSDLRGVKLILDYHLIRM